MVAKTNLGEERTYLAYRLQTIIKEIHNMKLRGRDWSRDHGEMLLLVVSPGLLSYVPYITQDHLTGDGTNNRGLNLH